MTDTILVPIDGSTEAEAALRFALEQYPDATVTVLHVVQTGYDTEMGLVEYLATEREEYENRADDLLDCARQIGDRYGRSVRTEKRAGRPWSVIVATADEGSYDHVILGSTGRHGASRLLLGSVAERVIRRSPVPVTVVR